MHAPGILPVTPASLCCAAACGQISPFGLFTHGMLVATRAVSFAARNVGDVISVWALLVNESNTTSASTADSSTVLAMNAVVRPGYAGTVTHGG